MRDGGGESSSSCRVLTWLTLGRSTLTKRWRRVCRGTPLRSAFGRSAWSALTWSSWRTRAGCWSSGRGRPRKSCRRSGSGATARMGWPRARRPQSSDEACITTCDRRI
eukprot:4382000-Prymnesium_polylepis.1